MAAIASKRSVMTLYTDTVDIHSHRVRIVLAEKGVAVDIIPVNQDQPPEDLKDLNPYNSVPTLVDRDLVLFESRIIMEYLDERFPHPPLMPVYPVARAKTRLMMYRVERDWYSIINEIETGNNVEAARQQLLESLMRIAPIFNEMPYFLSEEFSLVDCSIAPILWRLPHYGVKLSKSADSVRLYAERIFEKDAFQASLTEAERDLRETS